VSPPGRPKGESPSAQREGCQVNPPGRPKGESPSAQREGSQVSAAAASRPPACATRCGGFTLVELVIVILLMGILSFVAAARLGDRQDVDAHGFAEQLASTLRFSQKSAVAQRRPIYVNIDAAAGHLAVCLDSAPACAQPLLAAAGGVLDLHMPGGVAMTASGPQLAFDGLGRPSNTTTFTLDIASGSGAHFVVTVEPESGYVRRS